MAEHTLDCRGMKCPQPTLKMTVKAMDLAKGDTLTVQADCATFEKDVKAWVTRTKNLLVLYREDKGVKSAKVQIL
jgi:tRNA 2-thiouridine synthesizing protein A